MIQVKTLQLCDVIKEDAYQPAVVTDKRHCSYVTLHTLLENCTYFNPVYCMYYRMYLYVPIYSRIQKYRNQLDVVLIKTNTKN